MRQPPDGPPVCTALNFLPFLMPPPHFEDHFAQRGAHRHLDQADVIDLARQGEDFGALALSVPIEENHSAPRRMMGGILA